MYLYYNVAFNVFRVSLLRMSTVFCSPILLPSVFRQVTVYPRLNVSTQKNASPKMNASVNTIVQLKNAFTQKYASAQKNVYTQKSNIDTQVNNHNVEMYTMLACQNQRQT